MPLNKSTINSAFHSAQTKTQRIDNSIQAYNFALTLSPLTRVTAQLLRAGAFLSLTLAANLISYNHTLFEFMS
jgi:transcription termination factor NusB